MLTEAAKTYLLAFLAASPVDDDGITHITLGEGDKAQHPCLNGTTKVLTWLDDKGGNLVRQWELVAAPPPPARDTEEHPPPAPPPHAYFYGPAGRMPW